MSRENALVTIAENIRNHGYHFYYIEGKSSPRFLYTIGLSETAGYELTFAGAYFYSKQQAINILQACATTFLEQGAPPDDRTICCFGSTFTLREVRPSWQLAALLGVVDYYDTPPPACFQIVPDDSQWTIDVPDMSVTLSDKSNSSWRWLTEPWPFSCPESSQAVVDWSALRGNRITEATRWEAGEWELFAEAGDTVDQDQARQVPLGVMIGFDTSLEPVTDLKVGTGLWREASGSEWNRWPKS